jgi:type I restriction enzyme M protein
MNDDSEIGTRIVEVHNGSSLFTGNAGGGESNLRKYIIEHDLLEAIIAMPEKDFYNTGIGTFIWVLSNRKEERRRGKIQLIDATDLKEPLRKNMGKKNCEFTSAIREQIMQSFLNFEESDISKIFPNEEFGFWNITVERPLRQKVTVNDETLGKMLKMFKYRGVDIYHEDDTPEVLQRRIMEQAEWILLPQAIDLLAHGKIRVEDGKAKRV